MKSTKEDKVEIIEHFTDGILVRRFINGIEQVLPQFLDSCKMFNVSMPYKEFKDKYDKY